MSRNPRIDPRVGDSIAYRKNGDGPILKVEVLAIDGSAVRFRKDGVEMTMDLATWRLMSPQWTLH